MVTRCLRKQPQDRYQQASDLVRDLKVVQREIDSGITHRVPIRERLHDGMTTLRDMAPSEWLWPVLLGTAGLALLYLLFSRWESWGPALIMVSLLGLVTYRRLRNRRHRLMRQFAGRVRRLPEVRIISFHHDQATVVADKALARTYVRVNALMDRINRKKYFGEPYSVVVRDGLDREEERQVLASPGVLHVRKDVLDEEA